MKKRKREEQPAIEETPTAAVRTLTGIGENLTIKITDDKIVIKDEVILFRMLKEDSGDILIEKTGDIISISTVDE